jgi:hypothetical protein
MADTMQWGALARELSARTGEPDAAWSAALQSCRQSMRPSDLKDEEIVLLARAATLLDHFVTLSRLLYQYSHAHPGMKRGYLLFVESVNHSPFGLSDWLAALHRLHSYAVKEGTKIEFPHLREYLVCCIYSPEARTPGITLQSIVGEMLNFAGYEGP